MALDAREPARGADEELVGANAQISSYVLPRSRRLYLAQVHAVVNMGHHARLEAGILERIGHTLGDCENTIRET